MVLSLKLVLHILYSAWGKEIYFVIKAREASLDRHINAFLIHEAVVLGLGRGHPLWVGCEGERQLERKPAFCPFGLSLGPSFPQSP